MAMDHKWRKIPNPIFKSIDHEKKRKRRIDAADEMRYLINPITHYNAIITCIMCYNSSLVGSLCKCTYRSTVLTLFFLPIGEVFFFAHTSRDHEVSAASNDH